MFTQTKVSLFDFNTIHIKGDTIPNVKYDKVLSDFMKNFEHPTKRGCK